MSFSKSILCMLCASFFLVGCSYFEKAEPVEVAAPAETIDLMRKQDENLSSAEWDSLTRMQSSGSVEVYSLDRAPVQDQSQNRTASHSRASVVESPFNPSVEVYPLDGEMRQATAPRNVARENSYVQDLTPVHATSVHAGSSGYPAVYFKHGETTLDQEDMAVIEGVSRQSRPGARYSVEGFASRRAETNDPVQRKILNLKTSMNRALSVARGLVDKGVSPDAIHTVAHGEAHPGADQEKTARRVEIISR